MDLQTTGFDRVLHLGLFICAGIAFAVAALAVLERFTGNDGKRTLRAIHVAIPVGAFLAFGIAERLYHVFMH